MYNIFILFAERTVYIVKDVCISIHIIDCSDTLLNICNLK